MNEVKKKALGTKLASERARKESGILFFILFSRLDKEESSYLPSPVPNPIVRPVLSETGGRGGASAGQTGVATPLPPHPHTPTARSLCSAPEEPVTPVPHLTAPTPSETQA